MDTTMSRYEIVLRGPTGSRETRSIEADDVHVTAQGNVKLLNGKGRDAVLVAFFNATDVVALERK